ncbi:MAG TPA: hypothetical protein VGP38_11985 [Rubrobacter sp.]|nr:hypothetical protein [Rubrobacter sp.]
MRNGARQRLEILEGATGGVVPRSYVTNLRKGRIESPGYEKLKAIAKAMGFPPALWFEEGDGARTGPAGGSGGLAERIEHLFHVFKNPKTGERYTIADVARMSAGGPLEGGRPGHQDRLHAPPAVLAHWTGAERTSALGGSKKFAEKAPKIAHSGDAPGLP